MVGCDPETFLWVALFYTGINLLSAMSTQALPARLFRRQIAAVVFVLFDILALAWLMYLSGGVGSGLGVMILIAVSAGSVLVTGRVSAFLAAVATIVVLYEEFYVSLVPPDYRSDYFQAGVLGAIYFATVDRHPVACRHGCGAPKSCRCRAPPRWRISNASTARSSSACAPESSSSTATDHPRVLNQSARSLLGLAAHDESACCVAAAVARSTAGVAQ